MSRNTGLVVFTADRALRWIKYNGTTEHCYPKLYDSPEAVGEDWYGDAQAECRCGGAEPVAVYPYDVFAPAEEKTISWPGTACRKCGCLVTGLTEE